MTDLLWLTYMRQTGAVMRHMAGPATYLCDADMIDAVGGLAPWSRMRRRAANDNGSA